MFTETVVTQQRGRLASLLAFGVLFMLGQSAYAIGTDANTLVTNNVTVDYEVSSVPQTTISVGNGCVTCTVAFRVDNKIMMSIGVTNDTVSPGQTDQVLTYVITNTGNATQSYALTVANSTVADIFDMTNVRIYIETGGGAGFQLASDTLYTSGSGDKATGAANVLEDGTLTVYVVSDTPLTALNGETARYDLLVTTLDADAGAINTAGTPTIGANAAAWTPATMQNVFADTVAGPHASDAVNDGEFSATGTYTVTTAALTVTKSVVVASNPAGVTGTPKAIPGATLTYTITLDNSTGGVAATALAVNDVLPGAQVTYVTNSVDVNGEAINDGATGVAAGIGALVTITNVGANNETVTVNGFTVPALATWTITFDVLVD